MAGLGGTAHTILDALASPAALLRADGSIAVLNCSWRAASCFSETLGELNPGDSLPDACARANTPAALTLAQMVEAARGGNPRTDSPTFDCTRNGVRRWLSLSVSSVPDPATPVLVVVTDVTALFTAQQALRESEQRFQLALKGTDDGVFDFNLKTGEVQGSPRLFEMLGYTREELSHISKWKPITHPADADLVDARIRAHALGKTSHYEAEVRIRHKSGEWRWILDRGRIVERDAKGHAIRMTGLHTDITQRKAIEDKLRVSAQLAAVGSLSAGLAHEIATPLTALSASLQVLARELDRRKEFSPALELAKDALERVHSIARDVKAFSRANDADALEPTHVQQVLERTLRVLGGTLASKARLIQRYQRVPSVDVNSSRLAQVLTNLLVNAAQAIPDGAAEQNVIEVRTRTDARGWATISIRDTGHGISEEIAPRIFEPFFTSKPVGVGTGLGLSICHRLVTEVGGEITFESEVGRGTVFHVALPPSRSTAPEVRETEMSVNARRRILIIDDHRALGVSLQMLFQEEHDVDVVTCSEDALTRLAAGEEFDLVLCDVMMPGMTGMELFRAVEKRAPEMAPRFVFMTGGAVRPDARAFLAHTENQVLEKPFPPEALQRVLSAIAQ